MSQIHPITTEMRQVLIYFNKTILDVVQLMFSVGWNWLLTQPLCSDRVCFVGNNSNKWEYSKTNQKKTRVDFNSFILNGENGKIYNKVPNRIMKNTVGWTYVYRTVDTHIKKYILTTNKLGKCEQDKLYIIGTVPLKENKPLTF